VPADQTNVRFLMQQSPRGIDFDLELARGGHVTAVWRGPCGPGRAAGCGRGVALQASWSNQRVEQLLLATGQAGFPRLTPSTAGDSRATPPSGGGWRLEITALDTNGRWTGVASGSNFQSNLYVSIWGPGSFPPVSSAAAPSQAVQSAAETAMRTKVNAPPPYSLIGAQRVQWPDSCLGLPSAGGCGGPALDGWLLTYKAGDDSWWWARSDESGDRAKVDDGAQPILCGESGAGCPPSPPTCQACPPAPGSPVASRALPPAAARRPS
jgi:hypothetical protein